MNRFIALTLISLVSGHSWLECTNYTGDKSTYEPSSCSGYARCGLGQKKVPFGQDTSWENRKKTCQCPYADGAADYKNGAPKANYTPGQRVCLAYPPKNHVASEQGNVNIPDEGVTIKRTPLNSESDDFTVEYQHLNGKHVHGQADYKGFQNCPKFNEDNDKALCTMCFDLESDLAPGQYSFEWNWEFNKGETYITCWDATVGGSAAPSPSDSSSPSTPAPGGNPNPNGNGDYNPVPATLVPASNSGDYNPAPAPVPPTGGDYTPAPAPPTGGDYTPATSAPQSACRHRLKRR